jgi:hypothetical protein
MDKTLIIVLAAILIILILLNSMTPVRPIGGCAGTRYGCCANGVTPKMDYYGSNCYSPPHPPLPPKPVGGCAGTRYGCCPDGVTPKMDMYGSNCS